MKKYELASRYAEQYNEQVCPDGSTNDPIATVKMVMSAYTTKQLKEKMGV